MSNDVTDNPEAEELSRTLHQAAKAIKVATDDLLGQVEAIDEAFDTSPLYRANPGLRVASEKAQAGLGATLKAIEKIEGRLRQHLDELASARVSLAALVPHAEQE